MYISNEKRENLDRSVKLSQVIPLSPVGPDQVQRAPAVDWRSSTDSQGISSKPFIGADPGIVKSTNRNSTENVFSVPKYMSYALILHTRTIISCCTVLLPMRRKRDKALPSRRPWCAGVATRCIGLQRHVASGCNVTLHRVATCDVCVVICCFASMGLHWMGAAHRWRKLAKARESRR